MANYIDEQELADLWRKYKIDKDLETRNKIIVHYGMLVKLVVNRLGIKYKDYIDDDDLISYGVLGLMDAVEKYDITRGVKFETYASLRIRGAIIDQIRKQDWIPRNLRKKSKQIEEALFVLENQLGRPPKEEELAEYLSMSSNELYKAMHQLHISAILSFEEQVVESGRRVELPDKDQKTPEEHVLMGELKELLAKAIDSLKEKEQKIVSLYYFDELTFKEIGLVLGISESRVSQLHTRALMKLKKHIKID